MKPSHIILSIVSMFVAISAFAQNEITDTSMLHRFRLQSSQHSQVTTTAHYLTDVNGPRLTNSPGYIKASEWAIKQLQAWGLQNAHLEPWGEFGPGWSVQKAYAAVTAPYYHTVVAYPFAWTNGTNGHVKAEVIQISALDPDVVKSLGDKVKGKIILPLQADSILRSDFSADAARFSDEDLKAHTDKSVISAEEIKGLVG